MTLQKSFAKNLVFHLVRSPIEVYPDLESGKAVFRRSQLLDAVLCRENLSPVFMLLSEREQLLAGHAFLRHLAQQMNPHRNTGS